jgi:hypothetical protein
MRWFRVYALIQALLFAQAASAEPVITRTGAAPTQAVRMEIASYLERQPRLREDEAQGAPKLVKASIAGPVQIQLNSSMPAATIYCVEVDLIKTNPLFLSTHDVFEATINFRTVDGKQRIGGAYRTTKRTGTGKCKGASYTPFPELEQLRNKRRHELGKDH